MYSALGYPVSPRVIIRGPSSVPWFMYSQNCMSSKLSSVLVLTASSPDVLPTIVLYLPKIMDHFCTFVLITFCFGSKVTGVYHASFY